MSFYDLIMIYFIIEQIAIIHYYILPLFIEEIKYIIILFVLLKSAT